MFPFIQGSATDFERVDPGQWEVNERIKRSVAQTGGSTWLSLGLGGILVILGLKRGSLLGTFIAALGGALLIQGSCALFGTVGRCMNTTPFVEQPEPEVAADPVSEASWESFPASDSPSNW